MAGATLHIKPETCLIDDDIDVTVTGLPPLSNVTLVSRVHEDGVRLYAYAHYVSDINGTVDVTKMASIGGSYDGIEPMGFVNSQKQEPGQKPGRRMAKSDVTTPLVTHLYVIGGHCQGVESLESVSRGHWMCSAKCNRMYMAPGVSRIDVSHGRLRGTLFIPHGPGPFPGVVDLFGTVGGIVEHRAALLASRGIASLALCYFTPGKGEGMIADVEYFEAAVDYLLSQPKVLKPHVGIIGVSKGAELALLIASLCHKVNACVTINGVDMLTLVIHSHRGKELPSLTLGVNEIEIVDRLVVFRGIYEIPLEDRLPYQIPVEKGNCQYLLLNGLDDQAMHPKSSEHIVKRLQKFGKTNYRHIEYPGTGHLIEPPHSPHFYATYHGMFKGMASWGGNRQQHSRAQELAWREMLTFLKATVPGQGTGRPTVNKSLL